MKTNNRPKHQLNWLATTVTIFSIIAVLFSYGYLSKQANLLVETVVLFILIFFFNFFLFTKGDMNNLNTLVWKFGGFYLFIKQFINFGRYSFLSGAFTPFWIIPLIVGLCAGVSIVAFMWKETKFWGRVVYLVLTTFVITMFLSVMITNLNYALDFKEPTKTIITIEDKDIDSGRKSLTTYKFRFTQNNEEYYVEVPASDYYEHHIGDIYDLVVYKGAFGEEFYMSGKYVD